jgi:hypothetical protein
MRELHASGVVRPLAKLPVGVVPSAVRAVFVLGPVNSGGPASTR